MELSNGLFSSESLNGLLQQKWRNGQGDASSTYLSNKRKRDDVGQENNGVHNGNTELRHSLFPEPSRKNSKLDIFAHLATSHSCVVSHPFNPFGTQLVRQTVLILTVKMERLDLRQLIKWTWGMLQVYACPCNLIVYSSLVYNDLRFSLMLKYIYLFPLQDLLSISADRKECSSLNAGNLMAAHCTFPSTVVFWQTLTSMTR